MDQIKWLLVGTGDIVRKRVASALTDAEHSTIQGIVGGAERAADLANTFGIPEQYSSLASALANTDANAVYIATPVDRHRAEAVAALESGRPTLIEKPLGLNGDDAQAIADAAEASGQLAGCAYYRRCFPRYGNAEAAIRNQTLGTITLVRTTYHGWFDPQAGDPKLWRVDPKRSGGGPLSDMGVHMFDIIIGLFGLPSKVYAQTACLAHSWEVEDSSAVVMTMPCGAQVMASFGWNSKTWIHEFEIVGSEARIRWCPADAGPVQITRGRDNEELALANADNVHLPLVQDFVDALRAGHSPICPVSEAVKTNRLLDAIYQSAAKGCEVAL